MSRLKPIVPYLLAILSGVMAALPLNVSYTSILLVMALVPLLYAEHLIATSGRKCQLLQTAALGFIFLYVNQWIYLSPMKLLFSYWMFLYLLVLALIFAGLFTLFAWAKKRLGNKFGYLAFASLYVCFEYLLVNRYVPFAVIKLGCALIGIEGFGTHYIQWYEYTGVPGGTLWILICNVLFFTLIRNCIEKRKNKQAFIVTAVATFVLPIALSLLIYYTYKENKAPVEFVLVQPNYNPYTEKFAVPMNDQRDRMVALAEAALTDRTDLVVFPETALEGNCWYNNINENEMVAYLRDTFLARHDGLELLMGVPMMQYFLSSQSPSIDAIPAGDSIFLQRYNAAILVKKESVETYKKIILAPFSERMPFVSVFPFLTRYKVKKPGTFFLNHAIGEQQNVLYATRARIGCFICYESKFGSYCAKFADKGANVLCTVTNDGWWLKTNMAQQHLLLGQMRAIENRRSLVRCTNTGITAGIDQCGRIVAQAPWWEPTALNVTLNKNRTKTLYTQWGDYISVISVLFSLLVITLTLYKSIATHRLQGAGRIGKGRKS